MQQPFCVIDTEGTPLLREVAVFDEQGQLLFEARTPEQEAYFAADLIQPLPDILRTLTTLISERVIVAHSADHDRQVLLNSYAHCGLTSPPLQFHCTVEMSRALHPGLDSYNLGFLCSELEVSPEPFSQDQAHQAAYDARYTYYLYRTLRRQQLARQLQRMASPFSSSRVDTPFQHFADEPDIYREEYQRLRSVLEDISRDPNHQSKGAVIIGEPGTGKTHLIMRLAQDVLKQNRLLFIRQPTQESTVLFHTYSRILESLAEAVDDGRHNQLDLLLIRSIRRIFQEIPEERRTQGDREILEALEQEDLDRLGGSDTDRRRQRWERIETRLLTWWADRHSVAGYRRQILQGILRFCRYTDPSRRESCRRWLASGELEPVDKELEGLSSWESESLREEFSLQAIQILGALSCLDQPLILVFDQLEGLWLEDNRPILLRFGEVIKELFTHVPNSLFVVTLFPDRWQRFQQDFDGSIVGRIAQHTVHLPRPQADLLLEVLNLRLQQYQVNAWDLFTQEDLGEVTQQISIRACLNRAHEFYAHRVQGVPLPTPAPLLTPAGTTDTAQLANRLMRLEQQFEQMQTLLQALAERLEAQPTTSTGSRLWNRISPGNTPAQEAKPVISPTAIADYLVVSDSPFADQFRRYWTTSRDTLQQRWKDPHILNDSDDVGKLRQICLAFKNIKAVELRVLKLGSRRVPDNLVIKDQRGERCLAFLNLANSTSITARLNNLNVLVSQNPGMDFLLMRDSSNREIQSPGGRAALMAFQNGTGDGHVRTCYLVLTPVQRVELEMVYQLISDINNRDLEILMPDALNLLLKSEPGNWVVRLVCLGKIPD